MKKLIAIISIPVRILIQISLASHLFAVNVQVGFEASHQIIPALEPFTVSLEAQAEIDKYASGGRSWIKFKYREQIAKTASKYNLDPQLIYATIMTESEGNEFAYRFELSLNEASYCMG